MSRLHYRQLEDRSVDETLQARLASSGLHPVIARCLASRQVQDMTSLDVSLTRLPAPRLLSGVSQAAEQLGQAIVQGQRLLIAGDYDADGATATAVMVLGLRRLGAQVDFIVPDRFRLGYGLTPALVDQALARAGGARPDWIITVDNGISAMAGVAHAQSLGIQVLVTDHHLPGQETPDCLVINPQLGGDEFPSRQLAGVGVAFYLVMAIRTWLAQQTQPTGSHPTADMPRIDDLLALVALGTVADLVRLDDLNRLLVSQGLRRIQRGNCPAGITALFQVAGKNPAQAQAEDLGFAIGPRLNAAGRLTDMTIGIQCLLAESPQAALPLAQQLQTLNVERREQESTSREEALLLAQSLEAHQSRRAFVLFDPKWSIGLVGLLASRVKDHFYRPSLVFGQGEDGSLKGSGRSIPGLHLRDVLERVHTQHPGLIVAFGGHAMAAGLTLANVDQLPLFERAVEEAIGVFAHDESLFENKLVTDGPLAAEAHDLGLVQAIEQVVWGQGFPKPLFRNHFRIVSQQRLKDRHLRLGLQLPQAPAHRLQAIWFDAPETLPPEVELAYELQINDWQGHQSLQLLIRAAQAQPGAAAETR
ncbi:MAG: single-stranded-DNA-specific exonuclease RecJ [Burkholderiaceae bacterium]